MKSNKPWLLCGALVCMATACSSSDQASLAPSCTASASANIVTASTAAPTGINVVALTVNGSQCAASVKQQYPNEICGSIKICDAGTANCATISNLLVDTGSYGVRIYASVLTAAGLNTVSTTAPIVTGGKTLAECVGFGDGSSEWGPVGLFDVAMGGEGTSSNVPILMINSTYQTPPSACNSKNSTPDVSPSQTGFNGIIGVGLFDQDCGADCVGSANNGQYYGCVGGTCTGSTATLAQQVRNPVAAIPADAGNGGKSDNNGVIMQFPPVPDAGATSLSGYMILGIGTRTNNTPSNVQMYPADGYGTFTAVFNPFSSSSLTSFIDSGSSLLFFPWPPPASPSLSSIVPNCGSGLSGFYCPTTTQAFAASTTGYGGTPTSCTAFNVANANNQLSSSNMVFSNLAGASGSDISSDFDWGLPFFFGRKVYVGITGKTSTGLGKGPFWAF